MTRSRLFIAVATAAATGAAVFATSGPASASDAHTPTVKVLDSTVAAPFQLDFAKGSLYVADGGTNLISRLTGNGLKTVLSTGPGLAALGINGRGDIAYGTRTDGATQEAPPTAAALTIKLKHGGTVTADLLGYEQKVNPDSKVSYGIDNPTPCQEDAFAGLGGASYTGQPDSHPYAVAPLGDHAWVVADAGANDLLKVDDRGHVSTLAVLPRQPATITADEATSLGLPDCVVGAVYNFESVPTDVVVTRHGFLVSLLPGGPEDPSFGARGAVYLVSRSGAHKIAGGFAGATNLAVSPDGRIFVTELFGGQISVIKGHHVEPYVQLANPLSVTWGHGTLYAGTLAPSDDEGNPTGPGTLVAIR